MGVRDADIEVRGDSVAALTWAETERPRGQLVTNAAMVFTLTCICFNLDVKKGVHISGEDNWRCDRLSRLGESKTEISEALEAMGLSEVGVIDLQGSKQVEVLLACCDPARDLGGEEVFLEYWGAIRGALSEIQRMVTNVPNSATSFSL
jgi:hypothetical protein